MRSFTKKIPIPGKTAQELYEQVNKDIDRFIDRSPVKDFKLERKADQKQIVLKSSMADAVLICLEGSLQLDAKLSFLALPFRSKLEDAIQKWVGKTFGIKL